MVKLTCRVGKLILLALDPVLEGLCISASDLDLLLDRLRTGVRHAARTLPTASMPVAKPRACALST